MKRSKTTKKTVTRKASLVKALSSLPRSSEWFKMSSQQKAEFERARREEDQAKKGGFVLGGTVKQIL